jgi:hypothetical protein
MAVATPGLEPNSVGITKYAQGSIYTTRQGEIHNIYLPADATIHTVKHGSVGSETDWHAAPSFDEVTRVLTEAQIPSD